MKRVRSSTKDNWEGLLRIAREKAERSRLKTAQIEALIQDFKRQRRAGLPCPLDVAEHNFDLSKLLH